MAARQAAVFIITDGGDLERASEFVRERAGARVSIEVAPGVAVAGAPDAIRALAGTAREARVDLEITADDPLLRELARIYGIPLTGGPDAPTRALPRARHEQPTVVSKLALVEDRTVTNGTSPFRLPAAPEWGLEDIAPPATDDIERPPEEEGSFSFVVAPPVPRRPDQPDGLPRVVPDRRGAASEAGRQTRRRHGMMTAAFAVLAIVAIFSALVAGTLAPFASVTLIPATAEVQAELTYGLAGGGTPLDLSVEPITLTETLRFSESIPTTGERFVPDAAARGMVFVTNSEPAEATIPAGTYLASMVDGIGYLTEEEVTVPAADPFGSATFGTAVVNVVASEPGPDFNLDTNQLSGSLGAGLLYRNRFPLEGGTLKRVAVVTEADVEQLRAAAEAALQSQQVTALDGQLAGRLILVPGSQAANPTELAFSHEAGADAETLEIEATMTVTGQAYDPDELHEVARTQLLARLEQATPEGYALLAEQLQVADPQPVDDGGTVAFRLEGHSVAEAIVDPERVERLRDSLVGKDRQEAEAIVSAVPDIERFEIRYGPDWLPIAPVPRLESRVAVEVDASGP